MITINTNKEIINKSLSSTSKFVLVGNNIDGYISVNSIVFESFEELKINLPVIVDNIQFYGEWDLKLYAIFGEIEFDTLYDYYCIPKSGELIFEIRHDLIGEEIKCLITDDYINIYSKSEYLEFKDEIDEVNPVQGDVNEFIIVVNYNCSSNKKEHIKETKTLDCNAFLKRYNLKGFGSNVYC